MPRRVAFITGTRADWSKQRALVEALRDADDFEPHVIATGMHWLSRYGATALEVERAGVRTWVHPNGVQRGQEIALARTVEGFGEYVMEHRPDLVVVHGDRVEAHAGALVGALTNTLVAHIEGGEISGSVDESLRHATTKLSHHHFVANDTARNRIVQLGEEPATIHVIGSPDLDVMLGPLPSMPQVRERYGLPDGPYGLIAWHPDTSVSGPDIAEQSREVFAGCRAAAGLSWVCVYPNADRGTEIIQREIARHVDAGWLTAIPSMRFEFMCSALMHAAVLVGNSSMGAHEAPVYGTPVVNVGLRQSGRGLEHVAPSAIATRIPSAIRERGVGRHDRGDGKSAERFLSTLRCAEFWGRPVQKRLREVA